MPQKHTNLAHFTHSFWHARFWNLLRVGNTVRPHKKAGRKKKGHSRNSHFLSGGKGEEGGSLALSLNRISGGVSVGSKVPSPAPPLKHGHQKKGKPKCVRLFVVALHREKGGAEGGGGGGGAGGKQLTTKSRSAKEKQPLLYVFLLCLLHYT